MKVTIYTTTDCQFSKQEKEYLNTNKLVFEEKNLETNKDFVTEMLAISNNFAGTPVTKIEKDDGTIAILKGFTKEEFDTTFGFVSPADLSSKVPTTEEASAKVGSMPPAPINDTPIPPVVGMPTPVMPVEAVPPVPTPPTPTMTPDLSAGVPTQADPLKSVMDSLQSKSQTAEPAVVPPTPPAPPVIPPPVMPPVQPTPTITPPPPVNLPNVPEPDFK